MLNTSILEQKINTEFLSKIRKIKQSNYYKDYYSVVPNIQKFFASSIGYEKITHDFITSNDQKINKEIQDSLAEFTEKMELIACQRLTDIFKKSRSDSEKINIINKLSSPKTSLNCEILDFERIPQLESEINLSHINSSSSVLIIGTGAVSVSALAFSLAGAKVYLIDRDEKAIENFKSFQSNIPLTISQNIFPLNAVSGENFDFSSLDLTHILVAGLAEPKNEIIKSLLSCYKGKANKPYVLMRIPQRNLLRLFYYDVDWTGLNDFVCLDTIDIGIEGFNVTHILKFKN